MCVQKQLKLEEPRLWGQSWMEAKRDADAHVALSPSSVQVVKIGRPPPGWRPTDQEWQAGSIVTLEYLCDVLEVAPIAFMVCIGASRPGTVNEAFLASKSRCLGTAGSVRCAGDEGWIGNAS